MKKTLFIILMSTILFSCTTTKNATVSMPVDVSDKLVAIPEGKSVIYIVRPSGFGFLIPFKVKIDDREIGSTMGSKYLYAVEEPGKHTVSSKSENTSELELVIEAGKNYYIEQEVRMGLIIAQNKLYLIEDEEEGKKKLSKCSLPDSFKNQE